MTKKELLAQLEEQNEINRRLQRAVNQMSLDTPEVTISSARSLIRAYPTDHSRQAINRALTQWGLDVTEPECGGDWHPINSYIKSMDEKDLFTQLKEYVAKYKKPFNSSKEKTLLKSMNFLKNKAKTLEDIFNNSQYIINENVRIGEEDQKLLNAQSKLIVKDFVLEFEKISSANKENLEPIIKTLIEKHNTNFKGVGQPLRIVLTGSKYGPGIYDIIISLGKEEVIKRLSNKELG